MKKSTIATIVIAAAFGVGIYFMMVPGDRAPNGAAQEEQASATGSASSTPKPTSRSEVDAMQNPAPADPRLATLQVSPDNGLIEFVAGPEGRVIQEIDNDPNSLGYRKPSREYMYEGDKVVGLVVYRYLGDRVEITRTQVAYNPDGTVDDMRNTTTYEFKDARPSN